MNMEIKKRTGVAFLFMVAIVALFAMDAFSVEAQTSTPRVTVSPTTAMPGEEVTVTGTGFASSTVFILIRNRGTDNDDTGNGNSVAAESVSVSSTGSFSKLFVLADTVTKGNKTLAVRGDGSLTGADADLAKTNFTVNVVPAVRNFRVTDAPDGTVVTSVNNAIENTIYAEFHGFQTGVDAATSPDITFTVTNSAGATVGAGATFSDAVTVGAQRVPITIPDDTDVGTLTIKATQGSLVARKTLEVVEPTITFSPATHYNAEESEVTITGSNFGTGSSALTFDVLTIEIEDSNDEAVPDVTPESGDFTGDNDNKTAFKQKVTFPAATVAGEITIKVTVDTYYEDTKVFTLKTAPPGIVGGVTVTPGQGSLAVTWNQVSAVNRMSNDDPPVLLEKRPAATAYKVEWKLVSSTNWSNMARISGGNQVYHLISNLTTGSPYMIRVSAKADGTDYGATSVINSDTVGVPLSSSVASRVPGLVRSLSVAPISESNLFVSWNLPEDDGNAAITGYVVEYQEFGATTWTAVTRTGNDVGQSITGLDAETLYVVRVAAINSVGTGSYRQASAQTKSAIVATGPEPVTDLVVLPDMRKLTVTWSPSVGAESYAIEWRKATDTDWETASVTDSFYEITGLDAGTSYWVRVKPVKSGAPDSTYTYSVVSTKPSAVSSPDPTTKGVVLSNRKAGHNVRIDINAAATSTIAGGEDIAIELPEFVLPSHIDESEVLINSSGYSGNPSDVTVSGTRIIIEVPSRESTSTGYERTNIPAGDYSIKLKQGAGILNPMVAGDQTITITDEDAVNEEYTVSILHVVSLDKDNLTRGDTLSLTLKGFANGTATVYINNTNVGQTEVFNNSSEFPIDTTHSAIRGGISNVVTVVDSQGASGNVSDSFVIKAKVVVTPESTTPSKQITVKLTDWPANLSVNRVTIGGVVVQGVSVTTDSNGNATFKVTVPSGVNSGTQTVTVSGSNTIARTTIGVDVILLTVLPSQAVPGQQIIISGSGFATNKSVTNIDIGSKDDITASSGATTTSSGKVSVSVVLPLDVGDGDHRVTLEVDGRGGAGEITVPEPSIELNPSESRAGSTVIVTGSGFAANERVEVYYGAHIEDIGIGDGDGNFSVELEVPSTVGVGTSNEVTVKTRPRNASAYPNLDIFATATHKTPGPNISVPEEANVGSLLPVSGANFGDFSKIVAITIGSKSVMPVRAPETDVNGSFNVNVRVPHLNLGSHTITVRDNNNNISSETFRIVDTPVVITIPDDNSESKTPAEVFGVLGDKLESAWQYDNATKTWSSYSLALPAILSDITSLSVGDIIWVGVKENVEFQGSTLFAGWNLISLK